MMSKIYNYDKKHSHLIDFTKLLPNGKSFFTSISKDCSEISSAVEFLIKHDAYPNVPDKDGIYPLEYAIKINSLPFIKSLIDSNIINFQQLVKGNTYLHIAAAFTNDSKAFDFLLKTNLFDINSINDKGETPLMIACKARNLQAINLLFENNNLDYLHCDENGIDALNILNPFTSYKDVKQSKEAYHKKIVSIINNHNDKY